jgi:phosphoserine phosphatase
MTKIILTRHGHVEGISPERFRGRTELPLTERGIRQARDTARRISATWRPACVITSPMGRCVATGEAIAEATGVGRATLSALNDLDYGRWQLRTRAEMQLPATGAPEFELTRYLKEMNFLSAHRSSSPIWPATQSVFRGVSRCRRV